MRVYNNNILGIWKHRTTGNIYKFREKHVCVWHNGKIKILDYTIETRNEFSTLVFPETKQRFPFVVMSNNMFSVSNKQGKFICFDKINEQEFDAYLNATNI